MDPVVPETTDLTPIEEFSLTETEEFTFTEAETPVIPETNAFLSGFLKYYQSRQFCDLVLLGPGGNRIYAHKLILGYSSRFFSQLLQLKCSPFSFFTLILQRLMILSQL